MPSNPTFSVVIPVFNRREACVRAIRSLLHQTYDPSLFEIIVVDDGSNDHLEEYIEGCLGPFEKMPKFTLHSIEHRGRQAARNKGNELAEREWLCQLDSDDEYISTYLEHFAKAIEQAPAIKVFTCGALVFNDQNGWFKTREVFIPKQGEQFKSGRIGTGSFVFHRDVAPELPVATHPYGSNGSFSAKAQNIWKGLQEMYGQNEQGQWLPLGNPHGDDYVAFYAMTRLHDVVGIPLPLYCQHVRN